MHQLNVWRSNHARIRFITPEIKQLMKTHEYRHKKAMKANDKLHWNAFRFFIQEVVNIPKEL